MVIRGIITNIDITDDILKEAPPIPLIPITIDTGTVTNRGKVIHTGSDIPKALLDKAVQDRVFEWAQVSAAQKDLPFRIPTALSLYSEVGPNEDKASVRQAHHYHLSHLKIPTDFYYKKE